MVVGVVVVVVGVVVVVVGVVVTVVGPTVIAAFRGVLFVFTVANLAIGVALAPRYAASPPDAIYGNNLAQQITSTFDVVICALSLAVLVAMLFTVHSPLTWVRHREARTAAPPAPEPSAPPTIVRRPQRSQMPRIARLKEDSTTMLAAPATEEFSAASLQAVASPLPYDEPVTSTVAPDTASRRRSG